MTEQELNWLAGLLEGEGSFGATIRSAKYCVNSRYTEIKIQLKMCDEDVVKKAAVLMDANVRRYEHKNKKPNWNPYYAAILQGQKAADLMILLLPFMGIRRKAAIEKALLMWEERRTHRDARLDQIARMRAHSGVYGVN